MEKTQHTPGPWRASRNSYSGGQYDVKADNGRGKLVCETSGHDSVANAHLIAAAPELLEACRQIAWKLSHNMSPSGRGDDCIPATIDRRDITVKMAEAAIAKALGQD